ncbi:hypothetical protein GJ744_005344 [Endocarpon pusillum]|uniref:Uncharacterized protein n=1 Tax=Endocarpon pusillum TaxID=364733 RepID=A0A8H7ALA1_9EURO|nr:hypothetical protein GJ744_005344 [Endocarpon pusillum]
MIFGALTSAQPRAALTEIHSLLASLSQVVAVVRMKISSSNAPASQQRKPVLHFYIITSMVTIALNAQTAAVTLTS